MNSNTFTGNKTRFMVQIAILSALSFLLMMLEFPIPFMPPWLKIDLSEIPIIFAGFSMGPVAGIFVALIKNVLHFILKNNDGTVVGEIASFLVGVALIVPAAIIYRKNPSKKQMLIALTVGSVVMIIVATLLNYFVLLPVYAKIFMPMDKLIAMASKVNPMIKGMGTLIFVGVVPFNVIKCIILIIVTLLLYDRLAPLLGDK